MTFAPVNWRERNTSSGSSGCAPRRPSRRSWSTNASRKATPPMPGTEYPRPPEAGIGPDDQRSHDAAKAQRHQHRTHVVHSGRASGDGSRGRFPGPRVPERDPRGAERERHHAREHPAPRAGVHQPAADGRPHRGGNGGPGGPLADGRSPLLAARTRSPAWRGCSAPAARRRCLAPCEARRGPAGKARRRTRPTRRRRRHTRWRTRGIAGTDRPAFRRAA